MTADSLNQCPKCGGPADNGHDRCLPPNPYYCTKCTEFGVAEEEVKRREISDAEIVQKIGIVAHIPDFKAWNILEELRPYLATREPVSAVDKALENAAEILANFKTEGNRTKLDEWEAAYAMLFTQMNRVCAAKTSEQPVGTSDE